MAKNNGITLSQNMFVILDAAGFNVYLPGEYGEGDVGENYICFKVYEGEISKIGSNRYTVSNLMDIIFTTPLSEKANHTRFVNSVRSYLMGLTKAQLVELVGKSYRFHSGTNVPPIPVTDNHSYTSSMQFSCLDIVSFSQYNIEDVS